MAVAGGHDLVSAVSSAGGRSSRRRRTRTEAKKHTGSHGTSIATGLFAGHRGHSQARSGHHSEAKRGQQGPMGAGTNNLKGKRGP